MLSVIVLLETCHFTGIRTIIDVSNAQFFFGEENNFCQSTEFSLAIVANSAKPCLVNFLKALCKAEPLEKAKTLGKAKGLGKAKALSKAKALGKAKALCKADALSKAKALGKADALGKAKVLGKAEALGLARIDKSRTLGLAKISTNQKSRLSPTFLASLPSDRF